MMPVMKVMLVMHHDGCDESDGGNDSDDSDGYHKAGQPVLTHHTKWPYGLLAVKDFHFQCFGKCFRCQYF